MKKQLIAYCKLEIKVVWSNGHLMHIPENKESKAVEGTEYVLMDNEPVFTRLHMSHKTSEDVKE